MIALGILFTRGVFLVRRGNPVGHHFSQILATFLITVLALGSWWALVFVLVSFVGLAWRILDEEKMLCADLPGYTEYTQKVHYRLVPGLW